MQLKKVTRAYRFAPWIIIVQIIARATPAIFLPLFPLSPNLDSAMHVAVILGVLLLLTGGVRSQGGLFPPLDSTENLALLQSSTATSTCGECGVMDTGCATCNNSCPFGQQLPDAMSLLEVGTLSPGVVS